MGLPVEVDGYSGYRLCERPTAFELDGVRRRIYAVEDQWYSPEGQYFKVRADGKTFLLRYDEPADEWTLESAFDGAELFTRPNVEFIAVGSDAICKALMEIAGCEECRPKESQVPFDWVLADLLNKRGHFEFVLGEIANCPNCRSRISERTRVELQGGIEVNVSC